MTTTATATYPMFRKTSNGDATRGPLFQFATGESVFHPGRPNWTLRSFTLEYAKELARNGK